MRVWSRRNPGISAALAFILCGQNIGWASEMEGLGRAAKSAPMMTLYPTRLAVPMARSRTWSGAISRLLNAIRPREAPIPAAAPISVLEGEETAAGSRTVPSIFSAGLDARLELVTGDATKVAESSERSAAAFSRASRMAEALGAGTAAIAASAVDEAASWAPLTMSRPAPRAARRGLGRILSGAAGALSLSSALTASAVWHAPGLTASGLKAIWTDRSIGGAVKALLSPAVVAAVAALTASAPFAGLVAGAAQGCRTESRGARRAARALADSAALFHSTFIPNLRRFIETARHPMPLNDVPKLDPDETRVGIIGAGPAGIAAALRLKAKGYRHVTVLEAGAEPGGKVYSPRRGPYSYDMGATYVAKPYLEIIRLAESVGMRRKASTEVGFFSSGDPGVRGVTPWDYVSKIGLARDLARYAWHLLTDWNDLIEPGIRAVPAVLSLPADRFIERMGFRDLGAFWRPLASGFGYGYFEEVPAVYLVKLLPLSILMNWGKWFEWEEGYQEVFRRLVAKPGPSYVFDAPVSRVIRRGDRVDVETERGAFTFDRLIVAAPPASARRFMDFSPEERRAFEGFRTYDYGIFLVEVEGLHRGKDFILENAFPDRKGRLLAWDVEHDDSTYSFYVLNDAGGAMSDAEIVRNSAEDLRPFGGRIARVVDLRRQDYFPHLGPDALRAGLYEKIGAIQGRGNTIYVGGAFNFETVNDAVAFSQAMVEKRF